MSRTETLNTQIRTFLDWQREQILADCQAEIRRHETRANYYRRSTQKLSEMIESQQEELHRAQAGERHRRDQQLLHEQLLKQSWDSRKAHEKSLKEMEELKKFQSSTFDTIARRRSVEDQDTILELTGKIQELQKWDFLYEWFKRFSRCWISTQWTFPRYQSTCVFPTSSNSWRNANPFYRNAEPQRRAAKHLGHAWYIGKRFCRSSCVIFSHLIRRNWIPWSSSTEEPLHSSTAEKNEESNTRSRSEMPVWTVSQKFCHP